MSVPSHPPSKKRYRWPPKYLRAWAAIFSALALLVSAVTGLLITIGH